MIRLNIECDTIDELEALRGFLSNSTALPLVSGEPINPQLVAYGAALQQATAPATVSTPNLVAAATAEQPAEGAVTRRRRSKAEMEAARAAENSAAPATEAPKAEETPATAPVEAQKIDEAPAATEVAPAPAPQNTASVAAPAAEDEQEPDQQPMEAWTMATLRDRIGGLQTYVASARTSEILSSFGIAPVQIPPAPGASITPILHHLGAKNLSGLIESGQDKVNALIKIYDALMKG